MAPTTTFAVSGPLASRLPRAVILAALAGVAAGTSTFAQEQGKAPAMESPERAVATEQSPMGAIASSLKRLPFPALTSAFVFSIAIMFISLMLYRKTQRLEEEIKNMKRPVRTEDRMLEHDENLVLQPHEEEEDINTCQKVSANLDRIVKDLTKPEEGDVAGPGAHQMLSMLLERYTGDNLTRAWQSLHFTKYDLCVSAAFGANVRIPQLYTEIKEKLEEAKTYEQHQHTASLIAVGKCSNEGEAIKYQDGKASRLTQEARRLVQRKDMTLQLINDINIELGGFPDN